MTVGNPEPLTMNDNHKSMSSVSKAYMEQCTAHGISHVHAAPNKKWKHFWGILTVACLTLLGLHIFWIITKYLSYEKSVTISLVFEQTPFPAVTVCNNNPYKLSMLNTVESAKESMSILSSAVGSARTRRKRALRALSSVIARGACVCPRNNPAGLCLLDAAEIIADKEIDMAARTFCLCDWNPRTETAWPCYQESTWVLTVCSYCTEGGHCGMPDLMREVNLDNRTAHRLLPHEQYCMCNGDYNHCLVKSRITTTKAKDSVKTKHKLYIPSIKQAINPHSKSTKLYLNSSEFAFGDEQPPAEVDVDEIEVAVQELEEFLEDVPDNADIESIIANKLASLQNNDTVNLAEMVEKVEKRISRTKAMGYRGVKDELALMSRGRENMMFLMTAMSAADRTRLSHSLQELVKKCSFATNACDMNNDFKLTLDANYGNCYTFNWNSSRNLMSTRAGPDHGLRILLWTDALDQIPSVESTGFQVVAHNADIWPFPDIQGTSVPTGSLSSLTIKKRGYLRLPAPYGQCIENATEITDHWVFGETEYSVEGCYRSCQQKANVDACGCGHPLFPMVEGVEVCQTENDTSRSCLERQTAMFMGNYEGLCECAQPCSTYNYELSFSMQQWPSSNNMALGCHPEDALCKEKNRQNGALVQVFYRELNHEVYAEEPSYPFPSLLADFGGTMGLWLGISVVSTMELAIFFFNLTGAWHAERVQKEQERKEAMAAAKNNRKKVVSIYDDKEANDSQKYSVSSKSMSLTDYSEPDFLKRMPEDPIEELIEQQSSNRRRNSKLTQNGTSPPVEELLLADNPDVKYIDHEPMQSYETVKH